MKLQDQLFDAVLTGDISAQQRITAELNKLHTPYQYKAEATTHAVSGLADFINDPMSSPMSIFIFLGKQYPEWVDWEFDTVVQKLWFDFGLALNDSAKDRVYALRIAKKSGQPFTDWFAFNQVAMALCGVGADFVTLRAPDVGMVVFTATLLRELQPEEKFDEEVVRYLCVYFVHAGIYAPPPSLAELLWIPFKWFVSLEMQSTWHDVYSRYNMIVHAEGDEFNDEDVVHIQSERLKDAELAAIAYSNAGQK